MAGTWGIVADLSKIAERQQNIIVNEAKHYRRLNELKNDCRYEVLPATAKADVAGIAYYDESGKHAAVLLMRWNKKDSFEAAVPLTGIEKEGKFRVEDVDAPETAEISAGQLRQEGLKHAFPKGCNSALVFIDKVE